MKECFGRGMAKIYGNGISGYARFQETHGGVLITVKVRGLPENDSGFYALHIHEGSSCGGEDFFEAGSHYNPDNRAHPLHAGDLPPLLSCRGRAYLGVLTDRFCLQEIVGRTLVIHSQGDDFYSQPAGNAGKKVACGVIRVC